MAAEIISRSEAREQGLNRYFTGEPCKFGHLAERETGTGACRECRLKIARESYAKNREAIRERRRAEYRVAPEEHRKRQQRYRESLSTEERRARDRAHYEAHADSRREYSRRYAAENVDRVKEAARTWYYERGGKEKRRAYVEANRDLYKLFGREQRARDPEGCRDRYHRWAAKDSAKAIITANAHKRRARLLAAEGKHTAADLVAIFDSQGGRCAYCRDDLKKNKRHLDHIQPLVKGGSNSRENLQYLCRPCNLSKGAKDPVDFARSKGLLL